MGTITHLKIVPSGMVGVRDIAIRYGISKTLIYDLIRTDPTFPYKNAGLRKRFVIDAAEFDLWLSLRTKRNKEEVFNLPTAEELLRAKK